MQSASGPSGRAGAAAAPEPRTRCSYGPGGPDGCTTCSDEAVEVRVVELLGGGLALVDTGTGEDALARGEAAAEGLLAIEEVSVALVDAAVGDVLLVHAKEAIAVVAHRAVAVVGAAETEAVGPPVEAVQAAQPARLREPEGRLPAQCA